jgi:hypothetical protein
VAAAALTVVTVAAAVLVVAWFFTTTKHPENGSTHAADVHETLSLRFYGSNPTGPAGADAESQQPDDTGNAWDPPPPSPSRPRAPRRARSRYAKPPRARDLPR